MKLKLSIIFITLLYSLPLHAKEVNLGMFKITHYCSCTLCCEKPITHPAYGITASGKKIQLGMVANNWLPFNTKLKIDNKLYIVEDRGAKRRFGTKTNPKKRIDIYCNSHKEARKLGIKYCEVIQIN